MTATCKRNRLSFVDPQLLAAMPAPELQNEHKPGATLPMDFPRGEFDDHQLILLEELYFTYSRDFILRLFRILAEPVARPGHHATTHETTVGSIAANCCLLSMLLGLSEGLDMATLCKQTGISKSYLYDARARVLSRLERLATTPRKTEQEWRALARLAHRQALQYSFKAAAVRSANMANKKPR